MKYILLLLLLTSCKDEEIQVPYASPKNEIELRVNNQDRFGQNTPFVCGWSDIYHACFCGNCMYWNSAVLTWVPDKVCGK